MRVRNDGSIQSGATPTYQNAGRPEDHAIYRCMVTKVVYTDDPSNITANGQGPRVLYDVVVLGGFASGQIISNCRLSTDLGGNDSYWERTLRASEKEISGSRLSDADGDIVYVQFIQGHTGFPVIVALDQGITTPKLGAKKATGPLSIRQFNGVYEEINKDGELIRKIFGGVANADKGSFKPGTAALVTTKASKDEKVTVTFKSGLKIEEDGKGDKVTITTKGGLKIETDGTADKFTVTTKGGAKAMVDGSADQIQLQAKGTGALNIKDGKVALGASSAELLQQISDQLDKLSKFLQQTDAIHTHIGNLGYPTLLPVETALFLTAATDLIAIKAKVDGIKGTL